MSTFRLILGTTAFAVPVTITVLDVFGYVAKVEGASMQPSLNPDLKRADFVLLNRWSARTYSFKRGEVVSLTSPSNPDQKIIKRIIGLEGDLVKTLSYKNRFVKIPEGHCWIEGDHHGQSLDSNLFGPVAMGLISAKASHIVWPPERWQRMRASLPKGRINVKPKSAHPHHEEEDLFDQKPPSISKVTKSTTQDEHDMPVTMVTGSDFQGSGSRDLVITKPDVEAKGLPR